MRFCSRLALDRAASDFDRSLALRQIAEDARPNRELAISLRPLLDEPAGSPKPDEDPLQVARREREANSRRIEAAHAIAKLLDLKWKEKSTLRQTSEAADSPVEPMLQAVRKELEK